MNITLKVDDFATVCSYLKFKTECSLFGKQLQLRSNFDPVNFDLVPGLTVNVLIFSELFISGYYKSDI